MKKVKKTDFRSPRSLQENSPTATLPVVSKSIRSRHRTAHLNSQVLADIESVKQILQRLVKPELVDAWFDKKVPSLNDRTPMQIIRLGKTHLVLEVLRRVEESIHL